MINKRKLQLIIILLTCLLGAGFLAYNAVRTVKPPVFSLESGFYSSDQELTISATSGCTIYYTLDGSDPTDESEIYTAPLQITDASKNENRWSARDDLSAEKYVIPDRNIEKCTIIRAVAVNCFGDKSEVAAGTYFVPTEDWDHEYPIDFPVVSLTTDPNLLFDEEEGALVLGRQFREAMEDPDTAAAFESEPSDLHSGANFLNNWSIPATFTYFEKGREQYSQKVDIIKQGANSTRGAQKPMDVQANKAYGSETFDYDILGNGRHPKDFLLQRYFRERYDGFLTDLASEAEGSSILPRAHRPVMLYIDGECWGCYVILEKFSKNYFEDHFGLSEKDIYALKDGDPYIGGNAALEDMNEIQQFIEAKDLSVDENYQWVCDRVDIDNYIDYYCHTAYFDNHDEDIRSNTYQYRTRKAIDTYGSYTNGKWHWVLIDLNATIRNVDRNMMNTSDNEIPPLFAFPMMAKLLANQEFRLKFCQRMLYLMDEVYAYDKIQERYQAVSDYMEQPTVYTVKRFIQGNYNFWDYEGEVEDIQDFWARRKGYMQSWMIANFPDIFTPEN